MTGGRSKASIWLIAVISSWACASPPESPVHDRTYGPTDAALARVAVIPFYAHRTFEYARLRGGVPEEVARERLTRVVTSAFVERGIDLVPSDEFDEVMAGFERLSPAVDIRIIAEIADREFGATGVLFGEVLRFRDVSGSSATARRPASVAFQLALYDTPDGRKLWAARFDETQSIREPDLVSDPDDDTPPDPLLSVDEIAQLGASAMADALISTR